MKNKLLLGLLVLVMLVALLVGACAPAPAPAPTPTPTPTPKPEPKPTPPPKDKIVIGMSRSMSGPLAMIEGSAFRPVFETWVPMVNAEGGIFLKEYGKKLPIELKIYDDKSDTGTMTRLTEKLIVEDKVDFLWPAVGTAMLFAQAPIANKYGYVLVTAEGGATTLKDALPSLPYTFVSLNFSDWYQIPVLAKLLAEKGAKTAYVTYIADLHGIEYSGIAGIEFAKVGIKILANVSLPPDLKDFAPIVTEAKKSGADVFCSFAYPDQIMPITGTSMALGYNPKAMVLGPGANFGFYKTAFGPATEGVICFATANRKTSPAMKEMFDKIYTGKPEEAHDWWGHPDYWAWVSLWKTAVEEVGKIDQKALRDKLATIKADTIFGPTWFTMFGDGGGLLAKECYTGHIGQWQKGICEIVGYTGIEKELTNYKVTAPFVYPKPAWPK